MAKRKFGIIPIEETLKKLVAQTSPTSKTNVPLTPEMYRILNAIEQYLQRVRLEAQRAEEDWKNYIRQCAQSLGVNDSRYLFDETLRAFRDNPNYVAPAEPEIQAITDGNANPTG